MNLVVGLWHGFLPRGPTLLFAFARKVIYKDNEGMLPLHLRFHNGCEGAMVDLLLVAYPQSVDERDCKGRTSMVLVQ